MRTGIQIRQRTIGEASPGFIIAEAGADAIKLIFWFPEEL
jgi:hypothetical protein